MHKKMPATTWLAWVHVFNYFTCLLDRGASIVGCFFLMTDMKSLEMVHEKQRCTFVWSIEKERLQVMTLL